MALIAYRPPCHDELLCGWLKSLAEENYPLDSFGEQRLADEMFPNGKLPEKRGLFSKEPIRKDFVRGLDSGIREMQADGYTVPDTEDILIYNTTLVTTGIAQTKGDQARYIHTAVSDVTGGLLDMPTLPLTLQEVRICPACMRENPYIRTWHNLPGVAACPLHGVKLGVLGHHTEISNWRQDQLFDNKANIDEVRYAQYAKTIYDNPSAITFQDIRVYLAEQGIKIPEIKGERKCLSFEKTVSFLIDNEIDYKNIIKSVKHSKNERFESVSLLSTSGPVGTFQCNKCGHVWTDAMESVRLGFGCPACLGNEDPDEFINRVLARIGDGYYRLTEPFQGMGATQIVRHDTCGSEQLARLSGRIWHRTTCACEKAHTVTSMQKLVDDIAAGFTVETYTPTKGMMTLRHDACGKAQNVFWISFKGNPTCPFCRQDTRQESTQKLLKERLDPDYEIIGISSTNVAVKHKPCGQIILGSYSAFLRGKKCPLCVPYLTKKRGEGVVTYESQLLKEMQAWFTHHPLWVSPRHRDGKLGRKYNDALAVLVKKGYIYKVGYGMYSNREKWTVYDLVKWKYLIDDAGDTVGRFTGETAAFLHSERTVEPDEITLESALLAPQTHSTTTIMGRTVKLSGMR